MGSGGIRWNQVGSGGIKWDQVGSGGIRWDQVGSGEPSAPHPVGVRTHDALADVLHVKLSLHVEVLGDQMRVGVQIGSPTQVPLRLGEGELAVHVRVFVGTVRDLSPALDERMQVGVVGVRVRVGREHLRP